MRPKGFKNPFEEYHNAFDILTVQDAEYEAYEAGADAYEAGLKKEAIDLETAERKVWHGNGYLVYLGDE